MRVESTPRPAEVLLVEDNPGDVRLTREALKEGSGRTELRVVRDGVELLAYLRRQDPYGDAARPDLILLDLNLPRMDGRQVLQEIKADRSLMTIPVVVFTSSQAEQDILCSYELGANCYVTKPMDLDEFIHAMRMIELFWLTVAKLPPAVAMDREPVRILLVEDSPGDARYLQELLREVGSLRFDLTHVERLDQALGAADAADVVLLDLSLPDTSGLDTLTGMLAAAPEVPIIVLTGLDDETTALAAVHAGAQDYLVKGQVDGALLARSIHYARERKQLERERAHLLEREREARATAERAVHARDEVLRLVAHDLGNSLSAVQVTTRVLLRILPESHPPDRIRRGVSNIRSLARQMQRLRQDLLDVSMLDAGHLAIMPRQVGAVELVEETVERYRSLADERSLALESRTATGVPPIVADPDRLRQVLANLVTNAIKFTPAGGRVVAGVEAKGEDVRFWVVDTGSGISAEDLPRIFDRFWSRRAGNPKGAGLGLTIARGIVEAHGGRMWAESDPAGGSTFSFTLPADRPAPAGA